MVCTPLDVVAHAKLQVRHWMFMGGIVMPSTILGLAREADGSLQVRHCMHQPRCAGLQHSIYACSRPG